MKESRGFIMKLTLLFFSSMIGVIYHVSSFIILRKRKDEITKIMLIVNIIGATSGFIALLLSFYLIQTQQGVIQEISFD